MEIDWEMINDKRCVDTSPGILWPGTEMPGQFCPGGHLSGYPFVRVDRCPGGQMSGQFCPPLEKFVE